MYYVICSLYLIKVKQVISDLQDKLHNLRMNDAHKATVFHFIMLFILMNLEG